MTALSCPSFFYHTIRVLLFDDDPDLPDIWAQDAEQYGLYDLKIASDVGSALRLVEQRQPIHACLYDLNIRDEHGDEFRVLREYVSRGIPCIILTARQKGPESFTASKLGAVDYLQKPVDFPQALRLINYWFFRRVFCCCRTGPVKDRWKDLCEILLTRWPESTVAWAGLARMTRERLKQICHECVNAEARHVLWLAKTYSLAFAVQGLHFDTCVASSPPPSGHSAGEMAAYWNAHHQALEKLITGPAA